MIGQRFLILVDIVAGSQQIHQINLWVACAVQLYLLAVHCHPWAENKSLAVGSIDFILDYGWNGTHTTANICNLEEVCLVDILHICRA